jgi:hypothetical protein
MRKISALSFLLVALSIIACASTEFSVKQLNESSAKRMIADYLAANNYEFKNELHKILPVLTDSHTTEDYSRGTSTSNRVWGLFPKLFLEQGFLSQRASTITYPKVSGDFANEAAGNGWWEKEHWILHPVPDSNALEGQFTRQDNHETGPEVEAAKGTIQPDGQVVLYNMRFGWDALPAQYYERGTKGYLQFKAGARGWLSNYGDVFVGPSTGQKVTVTYYSYALTPKFQALIKHGPSGEYLVTGNYEVEKVTNLRLITDTLASADFTVTVTLNSIGRLLASHVHFSSFQLTQQASFGKKPDQTWAIDAVTLTNNPFPGL